MAKHFSLEELSAYIDGEAGNPEGITRHLQRCAHCAQRHVELARLSAHVQALPEPDVSGAFAARVLDAVAHAKVQRRAWAWWPRAAVPLAATAAVLLVLSSLYVSLRGEEAVPRPETAIIPHGVPIDEQPLVEELERRLAEAHDIDLTLDDAYLDDMVYLELSTEDMLLALAGTEWFERLAEGWDQGQDFEDALIDLSRDETEVLMAMLNESTHEG